MPTKPEPDLFAYLLDLLQMPLTPTPDQTEETPVTNTPAIDMKPLAKITWEMYSALKDAGFTETQAFSFTIEFVKHMTPVPTIDG